MRDTFGAVTAAAKLDAEHCRGEAPQGPPSFRHKKKASSKPSHVGPATTSRIRKKIEPATIKVCVLPRVSIVFSYAFIPCYPIDLELD
jgi:hypothetical protein